MIEDTKSIEPPVAGRRVDAVVHTQGPWALKSRRCAQGCCTGLHDVLAQYDDDETPERQVATVNGGNAVWLREGETEGNAALIAAAPELLAMCRLLLRRELEVIGSPGSPFAVDDVLVREAEVLIAKATHLVV